MGAYCIADEDTVRGFRLVGVPGRAVAAAPEAAEAVRQAFARADCELLLLGEAAAAACGPALEALRLERPRPLALVLPGPGRAGEGRAGPRDLLRRLVGAGLGEAP